MKMYYVRHGKSMANVEGKIAGPGSPLAEEGLEQARVTGRHLADKNITAIVCSPYIRAQQTAETIAGELGIGVADIHVIDELHERRMGELEDQPKRHERTFYYENDTDLGFESRADLIKRTQVALEKIRDIAAKQPGAVLVVGHATAGFYFLQVAQGKQRFEDFGPVEQLGNAEFAEVQLA